MSWLAIRSLTKQIVTPLLLLLLSESRKLEFELDSANVRTSTMEHMSFLSWQGWPTRGVLG
jgi:hypothetical protein